MTRKSKIVVVDDNKINNILIKEVLSDEYQVVTFQDPVQVIDYLKNKKVDLVITDLMMPEMDGLELHQHIRYIQPELPVIIISANDSPLIMKAAQKAGIKEYLFKPINFNKLLNTVKSLTVPIL